VERIFRKWRWSWKILDVRKMEKYTAKNIAKYIIHILYASKIPIQKLKFMDESGLRRRKGVGPIGERVTATYPSQLGKKLNIMLLTSLANDVPFYFEVYNDNTDQFQVYKFIVNAIATGYIVPGDYLILDNASFHYGKYTFTNLIQLLQSNGIQLIFLPTYSPELNPVELVFGWIKRFCSMHSTTLSIMTELARALCFLSRDTVVGFYTKSLYNCCL